MNFFGRTAEVAAQYLRKGSQVCVQGSLRTRKWTDKDGVEKYSTEIRADNLVMLGSPQGQRDEGGSGGSGGYAPRAPAPSQGRAPAASPPASKGFDDMDDDIPF
ncbi:Single-stranded DNA-binding protein [compost metagenome]